MSNQIQDFNTQETARKSSLLTMANFSNNLWGALNNWRNGDDGKGEAIRSVFNRAKKPVGWVEFTKPNILSSSPEFVGFHYRSTQPTSLEFFYNDKRNIW